MFLLDQPCAVDGSTERGAFTVEYDGKHYDRFYDDGAYYPGLGVDETEAMQAERAFRDAFVETARRITREWRDLDVDAIEAAWSARQRAFEQARVLIPSTAYFAITDPGILEWMDSQQVAYQLGHRPKASRLRGVHHAMVYVDQAWRDAEMSDGHWGFFLAFVLTPWLDAIDTWSAAPLMLGRCPAPPRALDCLTDDQRRALTGPVLACANVVPPEANVVYPRFRSVADLVRDHPRLHEPVIHGLLREGETMNVIASPKMGKSWLVTDLAISVATGRSWLGCYDTQQGDVLILDNELHGTTTANRIPKVAGARGVNMADFDRRLFVENLRGRLVDIEALERYFAAIDPGRFKVVILDAFYRFMPCGSDENDNAGMAAVYNRIDRYAHHLGAAFILIHHTTKGSQSDKSVTDVGAGAGSQSRAADAHLILRPHAEDNVVVLDAAVRSWAPIMPRCLRWEFPVYDYDDTLDPIHLKRDGRRRPWKQKPDQDKPKEPQWTPERLVERFVSDEPVERDMVIVAAMSEGLSRSKAKLMLSAAEGKGLIHPWRFGANRKVKIATIEQPADEDETGE